MISALLAQIRNPVLPDTIGGGSSPDYQVGATVVGQIIGAVIGMLLIFAFILTIFFILTGALSWITSSGDKAQLESARNKIIHALIGVIIIFAVWAILNIVGPFLGIDFPDIPLPTLPSVIQRGGGLDSIDSSRYPYIPPEQRTNPNQYSID
ncbi:hypothetical protein A2154_02275 [Candidatus Gottesmanbacteria bacterium RBG_16_43_7]|uniref:Uncharacterized protein n=1 Tax=Candidatus Gottesmanbacteria bacterium RBG_16_43_7 TaxID=1798373 RepID=A0A1F5ZAS6_9BACT|nr:MAG: hypothetical protein A2154_02275 [Candidatus Gottesmanbacteria bacterium RBG_16_43_7]